MYKLMLLLALSNCSILSFQQMGGTLSYDEEPRVQIIIRPVAIRHSAILAEQKPKSPEQASVIAPSVSVIVFPQPKTNATIVIAAIRNITQTNEQK